MKRVTIVTILISIVIIVGSCGLKRKNPLDPLSNPTIEVPKTIADLTVYTSSAGSTNKYVELHWTANHINNTDGYFIYRSLQYYGTYTKVDTTFTNNANHGSKPWHNVRSGEYWYKVSAFKDYNSGRLEGYACQPRWVSIP
ncbi:MAG: hypothetical protein GX122_02435 [Candidatus Cloacimonetes bacterium]|nr:hypothetical protein [Candidatus Cloacimonadota bacterium]